MSKKKFLSISKSGMYSLALIAMPAPPRSVESHIVAYLHDGSPEVHSLRANRAVPELLEPANLLRGSLDVVGVLGDALVCATLGEAHVGVDLAGGHLGAERPDTEACGHVGRFCCEWYGVERGCCGGQERFDGVVN
jgi:hypothetical protein